MTKRQESAGAVARDLVRGAPIAPEPEPGAVAPVGSEHVVTPGRDRGTQRQLTVYLEPETAAQLAELAAREDRPVAYIARRIIREFFGD